MEKAITLHRNVPIKKEIFEVVDRAEKMVLISTLACFYVQHLQLFVEWLGDEIATLQQE